MTGKKKRPSRVIAGGRNAARRYCGETLYGKLAETRIDLSQNRWQPTYMPSARYIELRAAITTVIVVAMLLGAAIYQALELERLP